MVADAAKTFPVLFTTARCTGATEGNWQKRVAKAIDALRGDPYPQNAETLKGSASARRIRVGSCRVVYEVYVDRVLVFVVAVGTPKP